MSTLQCITLALLRSGLPWNSQHLAAHVEPLHRRVAANLLGPGTAIEVTQLLRSVIKDAHASSKLPLSVAFTSIIRSSSSLIVDCGMLGHALPVLLPLMDDHHPFHQWVGVSGLHHILECTLAAVIVPFGPLLQDVRSFVRPKTRLSCDNGSVFRHFVGHLPPPIPSQRALPLSVN